MTGDPSGAPAWRQSSWGRAARSTARAVVRRRVTNPRIADYTPRSLLSVPRSHVPASRFAAVDVHAHLGRWLTPHGGWMEPDVARLIETMDRANLIGLVNLDGRWGQELEANLARYDAAHPGRFATFCHVDWRLLRRRSGGTALAESLRRSVDAGAAGLKVWKDLGLRVRDGRGRRVRPDDPRLAELWDCAGELGVPVLMHVADPLAFFLPPDRHNERLAELRRSPRSSQSRLGRLGHARLVDALGCVLAGHPQTMFVAAHLASCAEDLHRVAELLESFPNLFVDLSGRAGDVGRQPRTARDFCTRYADRVLFGTDVFPVRAGEYEVWFRLLETEDDCFPYSTAGVPPQGRWSVYGLGLDDTVLARIYADNALGLVPRLKP